MLRITVNKLNFGFRFKLWTVNPSKEMDFNGQTLPTTAEVNSIKLDAYIGYSFDFKSFIGNHLQLISFHVEGKLNSMRQEGNLR